MARKFRSPEEIIDDDALKKAISERDVLSEAFQKNTVKNSASTTADERLALNYMHNRIEGKLSGLATEPQTEREAKKEEEELAKHKEEYQIIHAINLDLKRLDKMGNSNREELANFLLQREGHDRVHGTTIEKARAADENVMSIGIDVDTMQYLTSRGRGQHEKVIDLVASNITQRLPDLEEGEEWVPSAHYEAESKVVFGYIHANVPGYSAPIIRLLVSAKDHNYSHKYITKPLPLSPEQLKGIYDLCVKVIHAIPVDRTCFPLTETGKIDDEQMSLFTEEDVN